MLIFSNGAKAGTNTLRLALNRERHAVHAMPSVTADLSYLSLYQLPGIDM